MYCADVVAVTGTSCYKGSCDCSLICVTIAVAVVVMTVEEAAASIVVVVVVVVVVVDIVVDAIGTLFLHYVHQQQHR